MAFSMSSDTSGSVVLETSAVCLSIYHLFVRHKIRMLFVRHNFIKFVAVTMNGWVKEHMFTYTSLDSGALRTFETFNLSPTMQLPTSKATVCPARINTDQFFGVRVQRRIFAIPWTLDLRSIGAKRFNRCGTFYITHRCARRRRCFAKRTRRFAHTDDR
jgi:hypothetical protein